MFPRLSVLLLLCFLLALPLAARAAQTPVQILQKADFGPYLADGQGRAIYVFDKDSAGQSNCNKGCIGRWQPLMGDAISDGEGLNAKDFGFIRRSNGPQLTYRGFPLYLFAADQLGETGGLAEKGWSLVHVDAFKGAVRKRR